jgi:hypothetical protein
VLSPVLLVLASACSGTTPAPVDPGLEAGGLNPTDNGSDADPPASDAATSDDAGMTAPPDAGSTQKRDAGTTPPRDAGTSAGTIKVYCSQLALGVCQSATIPASKESNYRSMCSGTADACTSSGLVGCCVGDTSHYCYYAPQYTVATAQQGCSIMNGTWSTSL